MIDLVLDAGHGGRDPGAIGPTGLQEKECNIYIAKKCGEILKTQGVVVDQTREDDSYLGLSERAKIANDANCRYFISIHINSADIQSANGTEVYALVKGGEGEKLAQSILGELINEIKLNNRGVKYANFAVLRETNMPAILIETCFISNPNEESLLREDSFKDKVALSIAKGFLSYIGMTYKENENDPNVSKLTPLIEKPSASKDQAKQWAKNNGGTELFIALSDLYWSLCSTHGEINPVVAYAQAALETGFGKFGGAVEENFKNPAGIKSTSARDDTTAAFVKFKSWKDGVTAHLDHLALYAGAEGYPSSNTMDPRHFVYLLGKVKFVEELSGNWAAAQDYGIKVLKLIFDIEATSVKDTFDESNLFDEEQVGESQSDKNETLKSMKDKLGSFSQEIDNLKDKCQEIYSIMEDFDKILEDKNSENDRLVKENNSLAEKVKQYGEVIDDILNLINSKTK